MEGERGEDSWTGSSPAPPASLLTAAAAAEVLASKYFPSSESKGFCTLRRAKQGLHIRTRLW